MSINWILPFLKDTATFNSWIGIISYWVPVAICLVGYTVRTFVNCGKEYRERMSYAAGDLYRYEPTETVGLILGRMITCFIPIANLGVAVFDFGATYLEMFVKFLDRAFNQPLVPRLKSTERAHDEATARCKEKHRLQ
jgi:hypothetical protein